MGNKHELTDNQIKEMRKEIFERANRKGEPIIRIPNSFVNYVREQDQTSNWKGQVVLTYIGILIAYRESQYTYKNYHMNLENIMSFIGANPTNEGVRKAFSRNSWLSKNDYVKNSNDIPYGYQVKNKQIEYKLASQLSKKEQQETIYNINNRQLRSIEPVRHTKGIKRVRGRGYQILESPIDSNEAKDYITFTYRTIHIFLYGHLTYTDFYVLTCLKSMTNNGYTTKEKKFTTSHEKISRYTNVSDKTIAGSIQKITYALNDKVRYNTLKFLNKQKSIRSKSILEIKGEEV